MRRKSETTLLRSRVQDLEKQITKFEKETIALKRILQTREAELKACDLAIFACIQKSNLAPIGEVTDPVMARCQIYSDGIGSHMAAEIASPTIKPSRRPKRKSHR